MEQREIPEFKQAAATIWDAVYGRYAQHELDFVVRRFHEHNHKEKGSVLDIGCGTGRYLIPLAKAGWDVFGIDSSESMLGILNKKAEENAVTVPTLAMDFRDVDQVMSFDLILSFYCIVYILREEELESFFRNVKKFLNKNGVFIFNFFNVFDFWKSQPTSTSMGKIFKAGNVKVDYTTTPLDSISGVVDVEDYRRFSFNGAIIQDLSHRDLRYYTLLEMELILEGAGFSTYRFYSAKNELIENDIQSKVVTAVVVN